MVSSSRHLLSGSSSSLHHPPSTGENKPIYPTLDPDDYDDDDEEELTVQEVQNRILRDQIILKMLQEQQKDAADVKIPPDTSTVDAARNRRRKKFARSQEIILKHMLKITRECGAKAFVYGILPDSGKPISAVSDNLRGWWRERVKFDHNAPAAIVRYEHDAGVIGADNQYAVPPTAGPSSLMELQDQTLGSILSALLQHCSPPQRKFPIDSGVAPPWWPTGNEEWWPALGFPNGIEDMPYKRPHDLKKVVKCGVIMAVLRHMLPKADEVLMLVRSSRGLQDKMSAKEMHVWFSVVKHEEEMFWERNKGGLSRLHRSKRLELADLIETGTGGCDDEVESDVNKGGGVSLDGRQAINDLMSLYESQILGEREKKEFDANVESLSQDLLKLIDSDAIVPMEFSYATKPVRFAQREPNQSCVDDEMKQMEMRHCLQLQQAEMKKKMKAPKRMSQNLHVEMSQLSVKQRQTDMNQNMQRNLRMQQLLNMNQTQQYHQSYQNRAYNQSAYNQIEMNQKNPEPNYVDPTGNVEFLRLQNHQNNNITIQNRHLEGRNFAFGQQRNLQQDQLAEISSGNYNQNQSQQHFLPAVNFLGDYDNSMQARNAGSAENQDVSTEMGYEFDEFELDYLIASADAFMHDI